MKISLSSLSLLTLLASLVIAIPVYQMRDAETSRLSSRQLLPLVYGLVNTGLADQLVPPSTESVQSLLGHILNVLFNTEGPLQVDAVAFIEPLDPGVTDGTGSPGGKTTYPFYVKVIPSDDFVKYVPITGTLEEFIADAMTLRDPITGDSYRLIPLEHPTSPYALHLDAIPNKL